MVEVEYEEENLNRKIDEISFGEADESGEESYDEDLPEQ